MNGMKRILGLLLLSIVVSLGVTALAFWLAGQRAGREVTPEA